MDFVTREISDEEMEEESGDDEKSETDLLPEYCHYRDEGCEFLDSCLNCPLPQCLYDEPRGKQKWLKELRNREIERLYLEGWKIRELAVMLGLSRRTIQRALKANRNKCTVLK
ncbi:MAG: helix-turn-helix domain-containing protein [Dehalococcoidia bacterium]|jgi:AraC-like DNA-binding protein